MTEAQPESLGGEYRRGRQEVRGLGSELSGIAEDVRTHARTNVELAKAEMGEQAGLAVKVAVWGAVALVMAILGLLFACLAIMFALATAMPLWAAALITTGIILAMAATAGLVAYMRFRHVSVMPRRTVRSLKEDVRWARDQLSSSTSSSASATR